MCMRCTFNAATVHIRRLNYLTVPQLSSADRRKQKYLTNYVQEANFSLLRTTARCRYVMAKRLGSNPSQIEGIDIGHNKTDKLTPGQTIYVVNMKYPHKIVWTRPQTDLGEKSRTAGHISSQPPGSTRKRKMTPELSGDKTPYTKSSDDEKVSETCESKPLTQKALIGEVTDEKKLKSAHWSQGLKASLSDPSLQVYQDDKVAVIKDKYPKAKYHWLVMPLESITTTTQLRQSHLPLLRHMLQVGKQVMKENTAAEDKSTLKFRYGYHAVASMSHLHMHVISQDFCSVSLKTKKHWNSFTTAYFVDAEEIIDDVETNGKVKNRRHMSELLKAPLKCHVCKRALKNIPELKRHIQECV